MKVAWWMYNNTSDGEFTMNSPRNARLIFAELERRGHEISLTGVPRPPVIDGQRSRVRDWRDPGPYADRWEPGHQERREAIRRLVQERRDFDPQLRSQRALIELLKSEEWPALEADVQYVELYPCVSLLAKLELAAAVLRGVLSGVPTILVDQDFGADCVLSTVDDLYRLGGWDSHDFYELFSLWSPHVTRIWNGFQAVVPPCYDLENEAPLDRDVEAEFVFGYVGNDYQREERLQQFYRKRLNDGRELVNAVWGRWRIDEYPGLAEAVGAETFLGPVPPAQIRACYRRCAASIHVAHRRFYACKLVAFRWLELAEAGRLAFADAALRSALELPAIYVATPEAAYAELTAAIDAGTYWELVEAQRQEYRARVEFSPTYVVNRLEAVAEQRLNHVEWISPTHRRRELLVVNKGALVAR